MSQQVRAHTQSTVPNVLTAKSQQTIIKLNRMIQTDQGFKDRHPHLFHQDRKSNPVTTHYVSLPLDQIQVPVSHKAIPKPVTVSKTITPNQPTKPDNSILTKLLQILQLHLSTTRHQALPERLNQVG